jgi:uncharacterized protein
VLREHRAELQRLGARRLGLFGSFARGEARPDSDVDLLVELDRRTFDRYMDLKLRLEQLLGRPVDLVLADRADILEAIERIQDYVRGLNYEAFAEDGKTLDAVLHNLEIIGEAAKRVPDAWKERAPSVARSRACATSSPTPTSRSTPRSSGTW